ncbi:hypothetical protein MtrunA17_Chr2g0322621 [Medicago truncatula]|uniref:Uncharacterized protein n=1 Tax=Medicago truncatula TaxID=3880 RepID=G7ITZ1_MEDTR|nr:uncharacterized protein LOC11417537 [Medicago truncatula]AES67235.2 hypothetical protein MTR_2g088320 [Medicago truncatula]RHN75563.1 hypothetical protein MtrunA17_Chr2g0322621 [Medicago truncatula]
MKQRTRPTLPNHFHKFLKPGTLARLRDSKITARSHRLNSLSQISIYRPPASPPPPPPSDQPQTTAVSADGFPSFFSGIYGPRCPQRKKLVAAKSVFFVPGSPAAADSADLGLESFGGDIIAAN